MHIANVEIIIPVTINLHMGISLIEGLSKGTILPRKIIIIDNSREFQYPYNTNLQIAIHNDGIFRSCHEAWNFGRELISDNAEYVMFLNDDLLVNGQYLARVLNAFESNNNAAVVCGYLTSNIQEFNSTNRKEPDIVRVSGRNGACFTVRKQILDVVPLIPVKLQHYYGDDWMWFWINRKMKRPWLMDKSNIVFHYGGATVKHSKFNHYKKTFMAKERKIYSELIEAINNGKSYQEELKIALGAK